MEDNGVISVNTEIWKFYLLHIWLHLTPKMNNFPALTEQPMSTTDFAPENMVFFRISVC